MDLHSRCGPVYFLTSLCSYFFQLNLLKGFSVFALQSINIHLKAPHKIRRLLSVLFIK